MTTLEIPGAYLDDVRNAAIWMCEEIAVLLRTHHDEQLAAKLWGDVDPETGEICAEEVADAKVCLSVLTQVFDSEGDTTVTAPVSELVVLLAAMTRRLTERLAVRGVPSEKPAEFLHYLDQMRWAASASLRIDPPLGLSEDGVA